MNREKQIRNTYLIIVGVFAAAAIVFFIMNGYNPLAWACVGIAAVTACYYLLYLFARKNEKTSKKLNRILSYAVILFVMAVAITIGGIVVGGRLAENPKTEEEIAEYAQIESDYVIVLGCGIDGTEPSGTLRDRLERTVEYLDEFPNAVCIVSGSQAPDEEISEAECMRRWLEKEGVAPERIVMEDQANNTYENVVYSYEIVKQLSGNENEKIAAITSDFHILRTEYIAAKNDIVCVGVPAVTSNQLMQVNLYLREAFALWKALIIG